MRPRGAGPSWRAGCWLLLIGWQIALALPLLAQDSGQICALSFEDRDADGLRDPDEGPIAHGIGASLQNEDRVTIASLLLEDSPFAADGLLCFDQLLAGPYQITLHSNEFANTTAATFAASVNPGAAPMLVEFGLQPLLIAESSRRAQFTIDAASLNAVLRGLLGSLIMLLFMSVIGLLIYLVVFRPRLKRSAMTPYTAPPSAASPLSANDKSDRPQAN